MSYEESARQVGAAADHELTLTRADLALQQSANAVLEQAVAAREAEISRLTAVLGASADEVNRLTAEVAALKARIAELEGDTNPPASLTLFGVTVTGAVRKQYTDLHPMVGVSRVFSAGTSNWAQESQHKAFPFSKWAVSNSYALSEAALPKYLATIPAVDKAQILAYADGHELEHPDKNLRAADVKARTKRTAPIIRSFGLRAAWCMMGYSLRNDDWLDWVDPDDVDVLCFDKYNSGNKKNPPIYQDPADMVGRAVEASRRFGKPWAFWETGTNQFGPRDDDGNFTPAAIAARVAWTKELRAELIRQGAECAIWFDRRSTSGSSWDASLDRASAEAWLG